MIEELPSRRLAYRFTHELVRRALYDRLSGVRRAELHLRVGEALERAEGRSGRALADLAHHFAAAAPLGRRRSGASSTTSAPRARRPPRSPSTRRRRGCAPRSSSGSRARPRARRCSSSSAPPATAPARRSTRWRRSGRRRPSPASSATASCWRAPRSATRRRAGVPGSPTRARSSCSRRRRPRSATENSELRVGLLGGLARALVFQGEHERGAIVRTNAVALARRLGDRVPPGHGRWCAPTGRGARARSTRSSRCSPRPSTSARSWATPRSSPRRWRGACPTFVALGDLDVRPARGRRAAGAPPSRRPSRSCSTWPSTTARRIALCDGRLDEAEAQGAALARVEPAADRDATPRASTGSRCSASAASRGGWPSSRRSSASSPPTRAAAGRGDRASSPCSSSSAWRRRRRRELARVADEGLDAVPRVAVAGRAHLPDRRLRGARRRGHRRARLPRARAARRDERDDRPPRRLPRGGRPLPRHARRDARRVPSAREEHFERAMELNRRMGAATWLAHTAYEYAPHAAGARPRRARAGRRAARRGGRAGRADRHAGAARSRPGARRPRRRPSAGPTSSPRARSRSWRSSPGA